MIWFYFFCGFWVGMIASVILETILMVRRHRRRMKALEKDLAVFKARYRSFDKMDEPYPSYFDDLDHRNNTH